MGHGSCLLCEWADGVEDPGRVFWNSSLRTAGWDAEDGTAQPRVQRLQPLDFPESPLRGRGLPPLLRALKTWETSFDAFALDEALTRGQPEPPLH
ncbi:hypothetical protein XA68_17313 [Ophiocordyceps unilateralis]|uniref:Uncharacterized protein n=1 Tax=Ophiocordyceps unilateralis TaxID=268505 RepID=A0A2A9P477_OPHUN|nr:hypothetical protein XA68_17313 [Ophiocordyceps unilateralis]